MAENNYTVIRQSPDQYDFTTPGDPVLGTTVYFTTAAGNPGSVFVPNAHYNAATVKTMVSAKAKVIDAVGAITGPQ
jgi:hypothetical protein